MCLFVPDKLLNHATQRDQTLHEGVDKSTEGHCQQLKLFERDLQRSSEKFWK